MSGELVTAVLEDPEPTNPTARFVKAAIAERIRKRRGDHAERRYISYSELVRLTNLNRATVIRQVADLERDLHIVVERRTRQASYYRIPSRTERLGLVAQRDHPTPGNGTQRDHPSRTARPPWSQSATRASRTARPNTGNTPGEPGTPGDLPSKGISTARDAINVKPRGDRQNLERQYQELRQQAEDPSMAPIARDVAARQAERLASRIEGMA